MTLAPSLIGLNIDASRVSPEQQNFKPPTWPPEQDFPISIDEVGRVISRYGDSIWDITIWAGSVTKLNFGDGKLRKSDNGIDSENSQLFRQLIAYWLYGPKGLREAKTLIFRFDLMRSFFIFCTKEGVLASQLFRFPRLIEKLSSIIWPSMANRFFGLLHTIWEQRANLGFYILDPEGLGNLERILPQHETSQTAYIPPRIWLYQLSRLREFLDDFNKHRENIEQCYMFCLSAYTKNAGSLEEACKNQLIQTRRPFLSQLNNPIDKAKGLVFHDAFHITARRFGIYQLLDRWLTNVDHMGVAALSSYFNLTGQIGSAYLLNFSLMRAEEVFTLRTDCLETEADSVTGENIFLLRGITTKTVEDDTACWITSPSAKVAVDAMTLVSRLRMIAANANPNIPLTDLDRINPYLDLRAYEPWRRKSDHIELPLSVRPNIQGYGSLMNRMPKLLDCEQMRLTRADLDAALLVTPTLNPDTFAVGKIWPLAWHQLRRTGAVNMTASGVVGDASIQYQLKHVSRAMTRYYGKGFYHLKSHLNEEAKSEYVRAMYEMVALELSTLLSPRFVSPHGEKRKSQLLNIVTIKDHNALIRAAKEGTVCYRDILLGGCMNPTPCPFGGIDSISRCGGGDGKPACQYVLIDKEKHNKIVRLGDVLRQRLIQAKEHSPLQDSIQYQINAVENTLNVIKSP